MKKLVTGRSRHGHGHATFSVKNERFTVTKLKFALINISKKVCAGVVSGDDIITGDV